MTKQQLIEKLNGDLKNEYTHMHFYLQSSFIIEGLHRAEIGEWLAKQATGEFNHIQQFAKMIVGLGGVPETKHHTFPLLTDPYEILHHAQKLESEVVSNYVQRMEECGKVIEKNDAKYVELFLEDQLLDSRADLDEINQMLKSKDR
jgi:bacterioferritin (cytochrome b1)